MSSAQRILGRTALAVVAFDQLAKYLAVAQLENKPPIRLIGSLLQLSFARNPGAAFSFATGATVAFTILAMAACLGILWFSPRIGSNPWALVFGAILGGAFGNLIDRLLRAPKIFQGHVVDFIELPHYPIFNLADSAIFCAAIGGIVLTMRGISIKSEQAES